MRLLDQFYIDGAFVAPHGTDTFDVINPTTEQVIAIVTLADTEDTQRAVAAANRAQPAFARTTKAERIAMLTRLHAAILARADALRDATIEEYGAPVSRAAWIANFSAQSFLDAAQVLESYGFTRQMGSSIVTMESVGVAALITPWNSSAGSICSKLAMAIAAGCASVIKPSEMSALQNQIVMEAIHDAGLPAGVANVVTGRGDIVGGELSTNPNVAKISFTGSTTVGQIIQRAATATMKRVSLALSGKSPTLILDDADLSQAVPLALNAAFMNNGQACIAGSRLIVPEGHLAEVIEIVKAVVAQMKVGEPSDPATVIGPLASRAQFSRVQNYIQLGLQQGATLIAGGEGRPEGLETGYFVKPTVFANVRNDMAVAREEIFGPVLSILTYRSEAEAIEIANDTIYGLQAYVHSTSVEHAKVVATQLQAGRVLINCLQHDPLAPFGGFKQSGIGREYGVLGLESYLEAKTLIGA
ncbi:aldehyde dehydrogenase (NAD+) [Collimonas sp. OK307]|uniref:aldehyde dehydrogenase family protein n=1 Tax=Collimonas sp. OK307 TaxID=1801620 RepID=UPI0008F2C90B|nr:aldehyde dehydrogenase family protein [Collimonas sp. OK307]SFI24250.1 aldehyde dehydrogenase (NAD+) [Collimonas sp. OK307]